MRILSAAWDSIVGFSREIGWYYHVGTALLSWYRWRQFVLWCRWSILASNVPTEVKTTLKIQENLVFAVEFSDLETWSGKSECLWLEVPLYLCCGVLQEEGWVVQPRPRQRRRSGPTLCSCAQPCAASMAPVWLPGPSSPPRSCSMGKEGKSHLLVYSFVLLDTLCTVKYCSMGRERKSRLLVYSFMLPDTLSTVKCCSIGRGGKSCLLLRSFMLPDALWEGNHAYCCVVSHYQRTAVWGRKASHLVSGYQMLSVLWSTAVWGGKADHTYCCVVLHYQTLCTLKCCIMGREGKLCFLLCVVMLPDDLCTLKYSIIGREIMLMVV